MFDRAQASWREAENGAGVSDAVDGASPRPESCSWCRTYKLEGFEDQGEYVIDIQIEFDSMLLMACLCVCMCMQPQQDTRLCRIGGSLSAVQDRLISQKTLSK